MTDQTPTPILSTIRALESIGDLTWVGHDPSGNYIVQGESTGAFVVPAHSALKAARSHHRFCTKTTYGQVKVRFGQGNSAPKSTSAANGFVLWLCRRHHITSGSTVSLRLNMYQEFREYLSQSGLHLTQRQERSLFEILRVYRHPDGRRFISCAKRIGTKHLAVPLWEVSRPLPTRTARKSGLRVVEAAPAAPAELPAAVSDTELRGLRRELRGLLSSINRVLNGTK
jgi:hypothetical protein